MLDRSNEIVPLTTAVEIIVGKSKRDTRNARKKKEKERMTIPRKVITNLRVQ